MSDPEPQLSELLDHLGDDVSRAVLAACANDTRSVGELAELCDVSEATIYRRLNHLIDSGLLEERPRIGGNAVSGGKEYRTAIQHVEIVLDEEGITVQIDDATESGDRCRRSRCSTPTSARRTERGSSTSS
ncbi:ArsR/SmtB family transcription factor [Halomarina halobia]|uniref:ArsR/SmtB family transcription factor n=1 Tax=Halomarina halobia TaxID=3033386 RepID=UPI0023E84264|nr:helix-turn-helix domain-containing protein [Halomarina sp. PSR21]